jgi:hypothetical protein
MLVQVIYMGQRKPINTPKAVKVVLRDSQEPWLVQETGWDRERHGNCDSQDATNPGMYKSRDCPTHPQA